METIVKLELSRAWLTDPVHGRVHHPEYKALKHSGSLQRRALQNCHYNCHGEKLEMNCRKASIRMITGELARVGERYQLSKTGKASLDGADGVAAHESPRTTPYRGAHQSYKNMRVDVTFSEAKRSDSFEADKQVSRGSSVSWARLAGAECPLNSDEEQSLSADVQNMLFLESQKKDLENALGREPTVEEWADHCNTSIFKLYARIGKGRAAKRKMIAANLPLVNSVAQQFHGRGLSHWELCQEGVQGLEKSADKYNTSYNTKFSSYSFLWIWERMSAGVKKFRNVLRISRTVYEMASILLKQTEEFQVLYGRSPSLEELTDISHVDADKIRNVRRLVRPVKSMDEPLSRLEFDFEKQVEDQNLSRVPWTHIMESELKIEVAKALQGLTSREQTVLEMRYGLCGEPPKGRAQVGLALDLTYESIRLIEVLRRTLKEHLTNYDIQQRKTDFNIIFQEVCALNDSFQAKKILISVLIKNKGILLMRHLVHLDKRVGR